LLAERREQVLAYLGRLMAVDGDLVCRTERDEPAGDLGDFASRGIAQDEPVVQAHDLAVDVQDELAAFVGYVRVFG
jgi:hypothetical protein